jgi:hypothetical protein
MLLLFKLSAVSDQLSAKRNNEASIFDGFVKSRKSIEFVFRQKPEPNLSG